MSTEWIIRIQPFYYYYYYSLVSFPLRVCVATSMNELIRMRLSNLLGRALALATPVENIKYVFHSVGRPHVTRALHVTHFNRSSAAFAFVSAFTVERGECSDSEQANAFAVPRTSNGRNYSWFICCDFFVLRLPLITSIVRQHLNRKSTKSRTLSCWTPKKKYNRLFIRHGSFRARLDSIKLNEWYNIIRNHSPFFSSRARRSTAESSRFRPRRLVSTRTITRTGMAATALFPMRWRWWPRRFCKRMADKWMSLKAAYGCDDSRRPNDQLLTKIAIMVYFIFWRNDASASADFPLRVFDFAQLFTGGGDVEAVSRAFPTKKEKSKSGRRDSSLWLVMLRWLLSERQQQLAHQIKQMN